jgi:hypothetical protein
VSDNEEKVEQDAPRKDAPNDDWVTKRSLCTFPNIFKTLKVQVEEDVKTRNDIRPNNSPYEFSMADNGDEFTVLLQAKDFQSSVIFSLSEHAIEARDDKGTKMFVVTLTFSDQGECKLHIHDKELELWQVRRRALEELFFHGY